LQEKISPLNVNSKSTWDAYSRDGWEKNNGREQTKLFAEYFLKKVKFPKRVNSLLDVGCAMGDALPVFHQHYPDINLFGCDFSEYFILQAQESYGSIAHFSVCSFEQIKSVYDVIYCSNVLEHFETYRDIARKLLEHCNWLYVLVPYQEMNNGQPLQPALDQWHVTTFNKQSFDYLLFEGQAIRIRKFISYTPGAWGSKPKTSMINMLKTLLGRKTSRNLRQIFYEIQGSDRGSK
jgi:hypothetical protein